MKFYPRLAEALGIEDLYPFFVSYRIVSLNLEETLIMLPYTERGRRLLYCITGPLEAGSVREFYDMLTIMENSDRLYCKQLAQQIRQCNQ